MANDVVRAKPGERVMDHWANMKLIDFAAGKEATKNTKEMLHTGVLHSFRAQGVQAPRSPFWRSKRPAQLGGIEASGSCHNIVVTTD